MNYLYGAIGAAALAVLALLYSYKTKYERERSKNAILNLDRTHWDTLRERQEAEKESKDAEDNYRTTRDEYVKSTDGAGGDKDPT